MHAVATEREVIGGGSIRVDSDDLDLDLERRDGREGSFFRRLLNNAYLILTERPNSAE